jgi:hypothetical protein
LTGHTHTRRVRAMNGLESIPRVKSHSGRVAGIEVDNLQPAAELDSDVVLSESQYRCITPPHRPREYDPNESVLAPKRALKISRPVIKKGAPSFWSRKIKILDLHKK